TPAGSADVRQSSRTQIVETLGIDRNQESQRSSGILFTLWFSLNFSLVVALFATQIFNADLSLRQALVITLAGSFLAGIPIAVGTYFGKSTGSSSMMVSRAVFGVHGNIPVLVITLAFRLLWTILLLILASWITSQ